MSAPPRKPTLRLLDYYVIEGISAFAMFLFIMSMFFWSRERYDFSDVENLVLGAVQGVCYVIAATLFGRISDRVGYDRMIIGSLCGVSAVALTAWMPDWRPMPFVALSLYAVCISGVWPALEAGVMHLPGRLNMPSRLGIYNLVWSTAGALGFFLSGFVFVRNPDSVIWIPGLLHLLQLAWILYHRNRHTVEGSTAMQMPHEGDRRPAPVKIYLRNLSWVSNSLGYSIAGAFSALTPHIGESLGLNSARTIWLGCSLIAARAFSFILYWKWEGWHYRRGWSMAALWTAPLFLTAAFFSRRTDVVLAACILLGLSLGLSYCKSIYYSLDSSDNKGQQGGFHEAVIGIGILLGPLAGAGGGWVTGSVDGAKATVIAAALLVAAGTTLFMKPRRPDTKAA